MSLSKEAVLVRSKNGERNKGKTKALSVLIVVPSFCFPLVQQP